MVNDPLVVLEKVVLLIGVVVWLKSDFEGMSRLRRSPQVLFLALMDSL